jgi:hypothetical protein
MTSSQFSSLAGFDLAWRWTQPSHAVLPPEVLATIRPFTLSAAAKLDAEAKRLVQTAHGERARFGASAEIADEVRSRLQDLGISDSTAILVSWTPQVAVATLWGTFAAFWDDFCYPSSDDVTVWPEDGSWVLSYDHEELFEFRRTAVA